MAGLLRPNSFLDFLIFYNYPSISDRSSFINIAKICFISYKPYAPTPSAIFCRVVLVTISGNYHWPAEKSMWRTRLLVPRESIAYESPFSLTVQIPVSLKNPGGRSFCDFTRYCAAEPSLQKKERPQFCKNHIFKSNPYIVSLKWYTAELLSCGEAFVLKVVLFISCFLNLVF